MINIFERILSKIANKTLLLTQSLLIYCISSAAFDVRRNFNPRPQWYSLRNHSCLLQREVLYHIWDVGKRSGHGESWSNPFSFQLNLQIPWEAHQSHKDQLWAYSRLPSKKFLRFLEQNQYQSSKDRGEEKGAIILL